MISQECREDSLRAVIESSAGVAPRTDPANKRSIPLHSSPLPHNTSVFDSSNVASTRKEVTVFFRYSLSMFT